MNIALFTDTCFPQINGVSNTIDMMVKNFIKLNHQVHVFAPHYHPLPSYPRLSTFNSTSVWFYPDMRISHFNLKRVREVFDEFKPDVVHVMSELTCGMMGKIIAQERNIPLFTTFTTHIVEYARLHGVGYLSQPIWSYLKWFHKSSAQVLAPSMIIINELRDQKFKRVSLFKRGVDLSMYHPSYKAEMIDSFDLNDESIKFLYVGRISKEKNIELLIKVFNHCSSSLPIPMKLFVIGDGPLKHEMEKISNKNTHFLGFQDKTSLAKWYASVDAFIFPSMSETFGNVILEAMASETLVVGAKQGGVGCILNEHNGIAIDMQSYEDIFSIMKHIALRKIDKTQYLEGMRKTCREHDWEHVLNALIQKYEQSMTFDKGLSSFKQKHHLTHKKRVSL
ncbi:MAG: glycosyltransferase family 1 protein [Erysipelotrichia bacterium]|jgi:glycosyltransferase involved in cell wall biosynthesis|nr:glycosyltransferase family 1 protein [Erysipelotrichia bacterium]